MTVVPRSWRSIFDGPSGRPNALAAYEHNGALKWVSSRYSTHPDGTTLTNRDNPLIVNLDGVGNPEIVVGANVFNSNGSLRWSGTGGQGYQSARNADAFDSGAISIAADLDLDGSPEVVTGNTAYRADGTIYWQIPFDDGYTAVANFDADDFPEIVVVSRGVVRLHEHDGTLIWGPVDLPGPAPKPVAPRRWPTSIRIPSPRSVWRVRRSTRSSSPTARSSGSRRPRTARRT